MKTFITAGVLVLALLVPASAAADTPTPPEIRGYTFCGWKILEGGGNRWTTEWDDSLFGAYTLAYARGMSCRAARLNVHRIRHSTKPPYRPYRPGYRCGVIREGWEFTSARCVKGRYKFRYLTGA